MATDQQRPQAKTPSAKRRRVFGYELAEQAGVYLSKQELGRREGQSYLICVLPAYS